MNDCIFCKIVKGDIPNLRVYEDDNTLAFLDIFPTAKGHTVVIPKGHGETVFDLDANELSQFSSAIKSSMERISDVLHPDGYNVGFNHGSAGGQSVPHLHAHVIPRYEGDGGGSMHSIVKNPGDTPPAELHKLFS
jgi:histidine triad (HIT) family protein